MASVELDSTNQHVLDHAEDNRRVSEISDYTLPELTFTSVLDFNDIFRRHDIESYVEDSDASSFYSEDDEQYDEDNASEKEHDQQDVIGFGPATIDANRNAAPSRQPTSRSVKSITRSQSKVSRAASKRSLKDPNLVTWDGPDDKENPHNWPIHRRWISTLLIAMFSFIAPMASTMVAPALDDIAAEFKIESDIEQFLVMSIFLLAFAIGPFVWGPLSEVFGRVRVAQSANMIFLVFNTICGFARSKEQMMAFRFLSGIGGSAPQAIGGGILSDCFRAGERGTATAVYSLMPFLSPALAPIMGGYMTQYVTWRWVFWVTSIFDAIVQIACFFLLRETYAPAILAKKVKLLKKQTGNQELHTKWQGPDHSIQKLIMKSLVRPLIMLLTQPALQAMALFRAYQYGLMYLVFATFPRVFEGAYNQDVGRASLNYLSLGVGFVIGLQISGFIQDKIYTWCKTSQINPSAPVFKWSTWQVFMPSHRVHTHTDTATLLPVVSATTYPASQFQVPRKPLPPPTTTLKRKGTSRSLTEDPTKGLPEYRLPLVLPFSLLIPIGLFIYGWSAEHKVHWIVPNIGTCILSIGLIVCFNCAQAYVVDTYTTYAASATGAAAFVRTMAGFSFPLFAPKMYDVLGVGWGNSMLGFVSLALGFIAPVMLWRYGGWLRSKSTYCAG